MDSMKNLIGVMLALGVMGFLFTGGADKFLAPLGAASGVQIGAPAQTPRPEGSTPDELVAFNSGVWGTRGHVAVGTGPTHFWIDDVLTGYVVSPRATAFTLGPVIDDNQSCVVNGYDGVSPVVTIAARESGRDLGISFKTMAALTRSADTLITNYSRSGYRGGLDGSGRNLEIVDVVAPKRDVPAHLVLLSTRDALVWSFHFEEGAALAGVTIIGGQAGGVLNLPDGVPVEALSGLAMDACDLNVMVQEYHMIGADALVAGVQADGTPATPAVQPQAREWPNTIPELEAAVAQARPDSFQLWKTTFQLWFSRQFGQNPRAEIGGHADVQVVVAGQAPQAPVAWRAPEGGALRLVNGPIYIIGDQRTRSEAWTNTIVQVAEQKLGAPLETVHPDNQPDEDS